MIDPKSNIVVTVPVGVKAVAVRNVSAQVGFSSPKIYLKFEVLLRPIQLKKYELPGGNVPAPCRE